MKNLLLAASLVLAASTTAMAQAPTAITPASGSSVSRLNEFTIQFDNVNDLNYSQRSVKLALRNADGDSISNVGYSKFDYETRTFTYKLKHAVYAAGTYKISFPDGYFSSYNATTYESEPLPGFDVTYTVDGTQQAPEFKPSFKPSESSPLPYLSRVEFAWPDYAAYNVDYNSPRDVVTITNDKGEVVGHATAAVDYQTDSCYFDFYKPLTEPGTYTFTCPAGTYQIADDNDEFYITPATYRTNDEFKATFTITGEGLTKYSYTPAEPVEQLTGYTITVDGVSSIAFVDENNTSLYTQTTDGGYGPTASMYYKTLSLEGNQIKASFDQSAKDPAVYYVSIPAGTFYFDGDPTKLNTPIYAEFTVKEKAPTKVVFSPAQGATLKEFSTLAITFPDAKTVDEAAFQNIYLYDSKNNNVTSPEDNDYSFFLKRDSIVGNTIYYHLGTQWTERRPLTVAETYRVEFPTAFFTLDGNDYNTAFNYNFTIDPTVNGITNVEAKEKKADGAIYTITGQRVNATEPGHIYIQNGRKFIAK